ncbi:hypothetical protein PVAP13_9KG201970 [Panicum virgatum]|uniref:Uncharacterized protein n=1 Tax=Panicum virgatum TaxID=38727 RepID=A0A8T0NPZ3_PANVG|nr:hypothetical protein PVAP13_9KG201970 [Panicum virgatum]
MSCIFSFFVHLFLCVSCMPVLNSISMPTRRQKIIRPPAFMFSQQISPLSIP